jgi:hypothetical protein
MRAREGEGEGEGEGERERERERENQDQSIIFRVACDSPCPTNIWKHSERTINT